MFGGMVSEKHPWLPAEVKEWSQMLYFATLLPASMERVDIAGWRCIGEPNTHQGTKVFDHSTEAVKSSRWPGVINKATKPEPTLHPDTPRTSLTHTCHPMAHAPPQVEYKEKIIAGKDWYS